MRLRNVAGFLAGAVVMLSVAKAGAKPAPGAVSGEVTITRGGSPRADRSGAVVYLEGVESPPPSAARRAELRQRDKQFVPRLQVVVKGTVMDFPNEDRIFHNVFSVSRAAKFDLGLYKSGESRSVELKRAGVLDVYCNIHPDMIAKIKVVENEFYAITDAKGRFEIPGVPAGTYPIVVWLASGDEARAQVVVAPGGTVTWKGQVAEAKKEETTHLRKDGTPYGRYK